MSATHTTNLGLNKPDRQDYVSVVTDINDNMDILDSKIGAVPSGETVEGQIGAKVPTTRKINNKALSSDVTIMGSDIPMNSLDNTKLDVAVGDLKSALKGINVIGKIRVSQQINKQIDGITHVVIDGSGDTRITTVDIIYTDHKILLDCPSGYQYEVAYYSSDVWATGNYLNASGWQTGVEYIIPANSYFAIQFRRVNSVAFDSAEDQNILTVDESISIKEEIESIENQAVNDEKTFDGQLKVFSFRESQKINKTVNGITFLLQDSADDKYITNVEIQYAEREVKIYCPTGYEFVTHFFSSTTWTTANHISGTTWIKEIIIPKGSYFVVQFRRESSVAFSNGEDDKYILEFEKIVYRDVYAYIDEISGIIPFRKSQKINKYVNGVTFLLNDGSGDKQITNDEIQFADRNVTLDCGSGYEYVVHYYKSKTWTTANHKISTSWKTGKYIIPKGSYYVVQFRKTDSSAFTNKEDDKILLNFRDVPEDNQTLYHIIVTGQSLAVGAEGNPALTTVTPYEYIGKAYQFNGGSRPIDGMENDTGVEEIAILDSCLEEFSSLREQTHVLTLGQGEDQRHGYQGETIDSAMGYWFAKLTGKKVLVSNHGFGGKSYAELKKGTTAYNNSIRAVHHAKELCDRIGWRYVVYAIAVVHGEADSYVSQTAENYKTHLRQWQLEYDADIKAITGQIETVQLFSSQTAASSAYNLPYSQVPNGVFLASVQYDDIHVVCPQYAYPITYASVHMNNYGYRALGEFFGVIMGNYFNNSIYPVLYPTGSVLSGTTITLTFNTPGGISLVYDDSNVSEVSDGNWGFELVGDENDVEITNVQIVNNKVEISLSGSPSADAQISYAYKVLPDEMGKIGKNLGVRGNLRNNYAFTSMFTEAGIPQWCCVFCIPVNWPAS